MSNKQKQLLSIIRRFNNHAKIYGYPSKSFEIKVKKVLISNKGVTSQPLKYR